MPSGPLDGLRVFDLSTYVAGPSGAMTLAQLGADVIRIDPIGGASDTRRLPLGPSGASLYWAGLNKGKKSLEIDSGTEPGRELILRLIAESGKQGGIVLSNSVGTRWPLYEDVLEARPDCIFVHILGHSDGRPAVDYTVNCEVGLPAITGPVGFDRPVNHVLPAWDLLTGLHAALGVLTADRHRTASGRGEYVTVALSDVALATMGHLGFIADVVVNRSHRLREGNFLFGSFGCDFATADGHRIMLVALTERQWRELVSITNLQATIEALEHSLGLDLTDDLSRYRHREVLSALVRPWFAEQTLHDVTTSLNASTVLWGVYRTVEDLIYEKDSIMYGTDLMDEIEQPGIGTFPVPKSVLRSKNWKTRSLSAPELGEHTAAVLEDLLGVAADQIQHLREQGVIR